MERRVGVLVSMAFVVAVTSAAPCRDRFLWPFSVTSVWNTPIGTGAQFVPGGIFPPTMPGPESFHSDQDILIRASPTDPLFDWIDQGTLCLGRTVGAVSCVPHS